jgi:protein-tyrosine phosphatase
LTLDVFLYLMRHTRPDFATLYTNHVAAAMHRYWAAAYPDDPGGTVMPDKWRGLYRNEIQYAMDCLDRMLGRLVKFAKRNDYVLLVCGSLGQAAHKSEATTGFVTIVDINQFMTKMGLAPSDWIERHAMVPCVSVSVDPAQADAFEERLRGISCGGKTMVLDKREIAPMSYDRSGDTFHLFVYFERYSGQATAEFCGAPVTFESLGWGFHEHQDNIDCTGRHTPHGSLLVYDPDVEPVEGSYRARISTLDIAPSLLEYFRLPVPNYMHPPDRTILDPAALGTAVVVRAEGGGVEETVKREPSRWRRRARVFSPSELVTSDEEFALHILFVCTGNICRSPMAERLAIAYGSRAKFHDFSASSAGTHAMRGHPIHPYAARILEKLGGDASHFAARQVTSAVVADADLVVTMTKAHRDHVLALAPRHLHRTFTLCETAKLASDFDARSVADLAACRPRLPAHVLLDIPDPIGHDEAFFSTVGVQIADLLPPVLEMCGRG